MARVPRPWFRFYVEAFPDRKLRRLKPEYRWLFVACLGAARQSPDPGVLLVADGIPMNDDDIADYAGMDVRSVRVGMKALIAMGLIDMSSVIDRQGIEGGIAYRSPTFQNRQFESDDVTKRTRKYRETSGDKEIGTFQLSSLERSRNGHGNAPETETETDTDTSSEKSDDPRIEELCNDLVNRMVSNGCKKPTITKAWRTAARLILTKDGRSLAEAKSVLAWSQNDSFWMTNIQSMPKFRDQYDKLRIKANQNVVTPIAVNAGRRMTPYEAGTNRYRDW